MFWPGFSNEATECARDLLLSWLSPSQREEFERGGCFRVIGNWTGLEYKIHLHHAYNIHQEQVGKKYCLVPSDLMPIGDQLLAQKVALETNEMRALKIANSARL